MKRLFTKSLALAITLSMVSMVLPFSSIALTQLTSNVLTETAPQIDSTGKAVWTARDGSTDNDTEVFYWNGSAVVQLTSNSTEDDSPVISNGVVAWVGTDSGAVDGIDQEIWYNSTGVATGNTKLTNDLAGEARADMEPVITTNSAGEKVVAWSRYDGTDFEIYYSKNGGTATALTADATGAGSDNDDGSVQAAGNYIIYLKSTTADGGITYRDDVYLSNNLVAPTAPLVSNNSSSIDENSPVVDSSGKAAWLSGITEATSGTDPSKEVWFYNGTGAVQITSNGVTEESLGIDGGQLTWQTWDGNDYEIYYNGTGTAAGTKKITNNGVNDLGPVISSTSPGKIIFYGYRQPANVNEPDWEILLYDAASSTTYQVTDDLENQVSPDINGSKVAWLGFDGGDYEVYTDSITTSSVSLRAASRYRIVKKGRGTILLGTLKNGSGKRLANKKVKIKSGKKLIATVTTNKKGEFKKTLKRLTKTQSYKAYFEGSGTVLKSSSKSARVKVKR